MEQKIIKQIIVCSYCSYSFNYVGYCVWFCSGIFGGLWNEAKCLLNCLEVISVGLFNFKPELQIILERSVLAKVRSLFSVRETSVV